MCEKKTFFNKLNIKHRDFQLKAESIMKYFYETAPLL